MTCGLQRGIPAALAALAFSTLAACAPERDVVAIEIALAGGSGVGGVGAGAGSAGAAGTGGGAGQSTTTCAALAAAPAPALVWFDFEDALGASQVTDVVQQRSASVVGTAGSVVLGPQGCGNALSFGNNERYMLLGDDAAWNLTRGSIDAWFWVPATLSDVMGIVSRDQYGDQVGHFSVFLLKDGTVMARLQQSDIGAPAPVLTLGCSSEPLPASSWAHFGFNFGPDGAALYVNGKLATRTGTPGLELGDVMCGASAPSPQIPELPLPWVIGGSIYASMDPPNVRQFPFLNGAIDNLRISAVERDFTSAF